MVGAGEANEEGGPKLARMEVWMEILTSCWQKQNTKPIMAGLDFGQISWKPIIGSSLSLL